MKFTTVIAALATASATESYQTNYDVSRNGKNVKFVYQISAQGSHTPKESLNLAKNPSDEPKYLDYVTALGIR